MKMTKVWDSNLWIVCSQQAKLDDILNVYCRPHAEHTQIIKQIMLQIQCVVKHSVNKPVSKYNIHIVCKKVL